MMKLALLALLLTLSCFALNCATQRPEKSTSVPTYQTPTLTLDSALIQLYERAARMAQEVQTLEGYGNVEIDAPELRQSLGCLIKAKRNESIQIVLTAFFGIVAAQTLLRTDSVFVHIPLQNTLLIGQNSPENLRRTTGIDATFKDAANVFLGAPELTMPLDSLESVTRESNAFIYTFRGKEGFRVVAIDSATACVRALAQLDTAKRVRLQTFFEEPEPIQNGKTAVLLPKRTVVETFEYPQEHQSVKAALARRVKIAYTSRMLNDSNFVVTFAMPRYAVMRRIEDVWLFSK
ncbi:MAG: DUF4292 domain-containing protein [Candidatus Thermochlorobacter sp.]